MSYSALHAWPKLISPRFYIGGPEISGFYLKLVNLVNNYSFYSCQKLVSFNDICMFFKVLALTADNLFTFSCQP